MSVLSSRVDVTRTRFSTKTRPDTGPGAAPVRLTIQKVSGEHQNSSGRAKLGRKSHGVAPRRTPAGSQPGRDLLTSHFEAGSRGVVLAALQQRSHSASQRREVKVQLLEPQQRNSSSSGGSSCSRNAAGGHKGAQSLSSNQGDDFSAMKEGHMDVGVCQQVDTIDRDGWASRMEAVHRGQLELQNQLLQSALSIVARCTSSDPAPAPPPVQQVDPAEAVINPSTRTSVESDSVTMGTHADHTREKRRRCRARVVSVATQANDSPPVAAAAAAAAPARGAGPPHTKSEAPLPPSTLEEARRLLRRLRRQKKNLDDNLEAAERARSGEVLHCQLEALAANSESSERARVKKTVDAWIHLIGKDVQARMEEEAANRRPAPPSARPGLSVKALGAGTGSGRPPAAGRGQRNQAAAPARGGPPGPAALRPADGESYLTRLYGRAPRKVPTPGLGRSPPLRFISTAAPVNRKPRPQAVGGAKGATMKGSQPKAAPPRRSPRLPSAESADLPVGPPAKAPSPSVAIPLAHPRIGPSPGCRHNVSSPPVAFSLLAHAEAAQETPERTAAGPAPAPAPPAPDPPAPDPPSQPSPGPLEEDQELAVELGAAVDEGLEVQPDLPAGLEQEQAEPPDDLDAQPAPSVAAETVARKSPDHPDEGGEIPGREFLSVADAGQEESAADEGVFDQDGDPSPPLLVYQGPVRPAENGGAVPPPPRSSAPNLDERTLERMVQWLEQQLMARMICGQAPPPLPEQNEQSDAEEPSLASGVAEAAGGGGLQFFVDAGVQVDSPLVKELVTEVLSEMVDQVLAPREPPVPGPAPDRGPRPGPNPGPGGPSSFQGKTVPVVPVVPVVVTPLPTPPPSPVASIEEPLALSTPAPSEATSLLIDDSPEPSVAAPPEPVATPIPSPEPSPPAEIPPSVHQVADAPSSGKAGPPSDDEEEARAEEAIRSPPRAPSPAAPPPQGDPKSPSAASDDSTGTASSSNSSTVTGSETGLKLVSEGELLISFNHAEAMTEADTSSSSLQDEDLEPPSEGQVKVHMMEMAHTLRGERSLEEEEELSSGELTDSIAPQLDRKSNHSGEAILEPTNGAVDFDPTPAANHMPASDLQSEPSQVLPFRRSSSQAGQPEVSVSNSAPPEKMSPSSEDSSDFF